MSPNFAGHKVGLKFHTNFMFEYLFAAEVGFSFGLFRATIKIVLSQGPYTFLKTKDNFNVIIY